MFCSQLKAGPGSGGWFNEKIGYSIALEKRGVLSRREADFFEILSAI
jgi:hypothetical protein